ncbi:hypothetical protein D3C78_667580 [compost metagenome]
MVLTTVYLEIVRNTFPLGVLVQAHQLVVHLLGLTPQTVESLIVNLFGSLVDQTTREVLDDCVGVTYSTLDPPMQLDHVLEVRRGQEGDPLTALDSIHVSKVQLTGQHLVQFVGHAEVFTDQFTLDSPSLTFVEFFPVNNETVKWRLVGEVVLQFVRPAIVHDVEQLVATLQEVTCISRQYGETNLEEA